MECRISAFVFHDQHACTHFTVPGARGVPTPCGAHGTVKVKVVPRPGSECTVRCPPCASTIRLAMARPNPALRLGCPAPAQTGRNVCEILCRNPVPGIRYGHAETALLRLDAHAHDASRRGGAEGVVEQVDHHALDLQAVGQRKGQRRGTLDRQRNALSLRPRPRGFDRACNRFPRIIGRRCGACWPASILDRSRRSCVRCSRRAHSRGRPQGDPAGRRTACPPPRAARGCFIWTVVRGVRSSCDAVAMNSDFIRSTSRKCVTSSRRLTAPSSRPSPSCIGVVRSRKARSAPSTASGSTAVMPRRPPAAASGALPPPPPRADSAGDRLNRSPGVRGSRAKNLLRGRIEPGHRPLRVGDDDRIIEGVDRRLGGLLGDEELTEIRAAHRPDPLGHPV